MAGVSLEQIPVPDRCTPVAEMPTDVCWCSSSGGESTLLMLVFTIQVQKYDLQMSEPEHRVVC